jgi:subtilase family serine protease
MRKPSRYLAALFGLTALASLAAVPLAAVTPGSIAAAATPRAVPADVTPGGNLGVKGIPHYKQAFQPDPSGLFSCQAPESSSNPVPCYGPSQIRTAYLVPPLLTGAGETIAIIDAFGDPYIFSDLALFDSTFRLPPAHLNEICIAPGTTPPSTPTTGPCPTFDPTNADEVDWAGEIALDTQWAHAIAPGATIDLVISHSDQDPDILAAQQYVIDNNLADVLSQSFGENELCLQEETTLFSGTVAAFQQAEAENMSVFASAGDQGAATVNCAGTAYVLGVNMPASDPLVTSVGGTHLNADYVTGVYESETVWNDSGLTPDFGAGGGGFSTIFAKPSYQDSADTGSAFRGVPDVSYTADVYNGVLAVCTACTGTSSPAFFIFGGTSVGSPNWAALTALADQAAGHRLGFLNPTLYGIAANPVLYATAFHDITVGNNDWTVANVGGYAAHRGWDPASGLGSPVAATLILLHA